MGRLVLPPIIIDTRDDFEPSKKRQPHPYEFKGYETITRKLDTGDYSLLGSEHECAVERKTKADGWSCVGGSRARFEDCLRRLAELGSPAIVIEASLDDFAVPPARTQLNAAQAVGSFISWSAQYRIPVFFCPSRAYAERVTLRWLMAYYKHHVLARNRVEPGPTTLVLPEAS